MNTDDLWELYEQLSDENRILQKKLGKAIVAANEQICLATSQLLMQVNDEKKLESLKKLNLDETRIKSLYMVACQNEHFEVCVILKERYRDILTKMKN